MRAMPDEKVWGQVIMEHLPAEPGRGWGTQGLVATQRARKEASRAESWRLGKDTGPPTLLAASVHFCTDFLG